MSRLLLALVALGTLALGCNVSEPTGPAGDPSVRPQLLAQGVVHRVSVGSHDIVPPGEDANYSLIAIEHSDGRITGEYIDRFAQGGGFHARVTCLSVVANDAFIGGIITTGEFEGQEVATRVRDNGTSTNDPPDEISISFIGVPAEACNLRPQAVPLFPIQGGEVKVQ